MTSSTAAEYARKANWQDFERLCIALLSQVYEQRFQRWGRSGQRQNGADAWANTPSGNVVLQCKGRNQNFGKPLSTADIDAAVKEISTFPHPIHEFIILTTSQDDAVLTSHAAALTAQRRAIGQSSVAVWGWQTISDHIDQYPKIQRSFFGHYFRSQFHHWLALLAVGVVLVTVSIGFLFFGKNLYESVAENRQATVKGINDVAKVLDDFEHTYDECETTFIKNMFVFSYSFKARCTDGTFSNLDKFSKQIRGFSPGFDADVLAELTRMENLFREDLREAQMAASMTRSYEDEVIRSLKDSCSHPLPDDLRKERMEQVKLSGNAAAQAQLRYYFILRDFISPEINAAKAVLQVHAREVAHEPIPEDIKSSALRIQALLRERSAYSFKEVAEPLTLSAVKQMSARDIKIQGGDPLHTVEEARWRQVDLEAALKSLVGRPADINALIECGVLKPAARSLAHAPKDEQS